MPDFTISNIDWIIILFYFTFIIWRGIRYAKEHENAEDYFLASRSLTWPLIGLNSASTLVTMDFYKKLRPQTTSVQLMWIGRAVTFVLMLAAAAWAPQIDKFPTLWQYLQSALSYIVPPIVALFFMGVFWKRANAHGAVSGIIAGVVSAAFFLGFNDAKWMPPIHFLYVAAIIFGLSCLSIFMVSLLTAPPPEIKVRDFTWQRKIYNRETIEISRLPYFWNYRHLSVSLIAFLALILLLFW